MIWDMVQICSLNRGRCVLKSSESHHYGSMFDNIQTYVVSISDFIKNVSSSTSHEKKLHTLKDLHLWIDYDENLY